MNRVAAVVLALLIPASALADGARYLIITPDNWEEQVQPLAEWKTAKGMLARVATFSETGFTATEIRNYIVEASETWAPSPEYVLLVGGMGHLPMPWMEDGYSDTYYGDIDDDMFVEIHTGRFPATSATEVELMVAKTLQYERTPDLGNSHYWDSAVLLLYEDWDDDDWLHYYGDVNWETGLMTAAGLDSVYNITYGTTPNSANVFQNTLEDGVLFAGHHGVIGGHTGCDWPGYSVYPSSVANGPMLPVIVSYSCQTMAYDASYDCGGELWMKAGSPADLRGGVAFVGQSVSCSYCAMWRSSLRRGFWGHIFEDTGDTDICTFGAAVEAGRLHYYDEFHLSGQYYASNLYGDPELNLWTSAPREIGVSHPPVVPCGSETVVIGVTREGQPLPGARVCLSGEGGAYAQGLTDEGGSVALEVDADDDETLLLVVTGRNLMPFEAEIAVGGSGSAGDDDTTTPQDDDDDVDDDVVDDDDDDSVSGDDDAGGEVQIGSGDCQCSASGSAAFPAMWLLWPVWVVASWIKRRRGL